MTSPHQPTAAAGRIVVGVDGSASSEEALRWALDEARARGCALDVVSAWRYPAKWAEGFNEKWADDEAAFAAQARSTTEAAVCRALAATCVPGWVHVHAEQGAPARVLLDHAADADLLVVGRRGRGAVSGLLLGSVSTECAHHSPCPVTIIPGTDDGG